MSGPWRGDVPHVVVVGDSMLDVDVDGRTERLCPDAPVPVLDVATTRRSPGGAGLTALLCAHSGARVTFVTPIADDDAGRVLAAELRRHVDLVPLEHRGPTRRKTRVRSSGQSLVRVDDGGPGEPGAVPLDRVTQLLAAADVVVVSDYGAGVTRHAGLRDALTKAAAGRPVVWDPHPRGGTPVPGVALVTPNLAEARGAVDELTSRTGSGPSQADRLAHILRESWLAGAVCVTAGSDGAYLAEGAEHSVYCPAPASAGDPCGAGDRFVASAAAGLARGLPLADVVVGAVLDASAWVAAGGAEGFRRSADAAGGTSAAASPGVDGTRGTAVERPGGPTTPSAGPDAPVALAAVDGLEALAGSLRAGGRTLVATGGCFDIVHAGHVATLQAARRLGDSLVVLLNSDASVRRLKGPGRPVVTARDRARVLEAFDCVDAVVVFDEDDPCEALGRLQPDVWAKGGDYRSAELPETHVVRDHGGRTVLLPHLGGRSTTRIIDQVSVARTA